MRRGLLHLLRDGGAGRSILIASVASGASAPAAGPAPRPRGEVRRPPRRDARVQVGVHDAPFPCRWARRRRRSMPEFPGARGAPARTGGGTAPPDAVRRRAAPGAGPGRNVVARRHHRRPCDRRGCGRGCGGGGGPPRARASPRPDRCGSVRRHGEHLPTSPPSATTVPATGAGISTEALSVITSRAPGPRRRCRPASRARRRLDLGDPLRRCPEP